VIGESSLTLAGHVYGCGGGGLHVGIGPPGGPLGHSTATAASQPFAFLKIVHLVPSAAAGRGRGGFAITVGGGLGGAGCGGGGFAMTPVGAAAGSGAGAGGCDGGGACV